MNKFLENKNLQLRAPEPEDLDKLYTWENDTSIWENGASVVPYSRYAIKQYMIEYKYDIFIDRQLRLMITSKASNECLGAVDLYDYDPLHHRAGVGILIDRNFRHKGYGVQALELLEKYAFGFLHLRQLYAIIPENNSNSINLFERAGYHQTGVLEDWIQSNNSFMNARIMQKINRLEK